MGKPRIFFGIIDGNDSVDNAQFTKWYVVYDLRWVFIVVCICLFVLRQGLRHARQVLCHLAVDFFLDVTFLVSQAPPSFPGGP
jgi:hypothetical protein